MELRQTRAIIDAIHSGELKNIPTQADPIFGFNRVTSCPNVPAEILNPRQYWRDPAAYDTAAQKLEGLFRDNYAQFEEGAIFRGTMDG